MKAKEALNISLENSKDKDLIYIFHEIEKAASLGKTSLVFDPKSRLTLDEIIVGLQALGYQAEKYIKSYYPKTYLRVSWANAG